MTALPRQFQCAVCGKLCRTLTTEAEANQELLASGIKTEGSDLLSACDDCYDAVMKRASELGLLE